MPATDIVSISKVKSAARSTSDARRSSMAWSVKTPGGATKASVRSQRR